MRLCKEARTCPRQLRTTEQDVPHLRRVFILPCAFLPSSEEFPEVGLGLVQVLLPENPECVVHPKITQ